MSKKLTVDELQTTVMKLISETAITTSQDALTVAQLGAAVHIFACSGLRRRDSAIDELHSLLLRGVMWLLDPNLAKVRPEGIANTEHTDELEALMGVLGAAFHDRCQRSEDTNPEEVFAAMFAIATGTYSVCVKEELIDDNELSARMGDFVQDIANEVLDRIDAALENKPVDAS